MVSFTFHYDIIPYTGWVKMGGTTEYIVIPRVKLNSKTRISICEKVDFEITSSSITTWLTCLFIIDYFHLHCVNQH